MKILVVEDDADLAQFIRKGLKEEHYVVDVAADGEAGLALALDNSYDLMILDIMLPKLDGLTLCRRVRDQGISTPVLLLTARNTLETKAPVECISLAEAVRLRGIAGPDQGALAPRELPANCSSSSRRPSVGSRFSPCLARRTGNFPDE